MTDNTENSRRVVDTMYRSALAGDMDTMFSMLAEDLIVDEPSFLPYGGRTRSRDEFAKLFATVGRYISLDTLTLSSLVADGEVVVAFLQAETVAGKELVSIAERSVVRNGLVVEMTIFYHEGGDLFPRAEQ